MYANLANAGESILNAHDGIVIVEYVSGPRGGRTLDVTGFAPTVIKAGHVIIQETSTGNFKPMPVNGGATAYASLPASHTYAGVAVATELTAKPFVAIMTDGVVNPTAAPYDLATIQSALKTAQPLLVFRAD